MVAACGLILVAFAFSGGPALAQVEGPCTITVATQGQASNVNSHSTPGTALPVRYGQILRIDTVSTGAITSHLIELELAGISWTADQGLDSGNTWGGDVNVSTYAGGFGLHKVTGVSFGPGACSGTAYVLVKGGNPLGGPVGAGAAAATGVGALALATSTVRAGKEGGSDDQISASVSTDPLAKFEPPITRPYDPPSAEGDPNWPYEPGRPTAEEYAGESPPPPKPFGIQAAERINKGCLIALPMALFLTMATMVAGAGVPAAPAPIVLPRASWRPRISWAGMAGGILMSLGILVLLQQYGVVYPTLTVTIVGLVSGVLTSILIPSLARIANIGRINRVIATAEARLNQVGGETGQDQALPQEEEAIPADWYSDPSGEARLRYWDGTDWTDDVAD